ncbi:protein Wiz-like isoform X2 [Betta splendens]|uniref:Protein Wiz-like isoform X2 n=1 Tax=Betta splendens TaxID=158456 RepID=A0A6P7NAC1_BETSP|nr:protein Wiz-like isoform X2 [Betta splendens]
MDSQAAAPQSTATAQPVICEACGSYFETRRGLSSHARLHLRQLGVTVSESSGAPIEFLYQLIQERGGSLPDFKADSSGPVPAPLNKTIQQESITLSTPKDKNTPRKQPDMVMTPQKMDHEDSSSNLKETTHLPSSPSALKVSESSLSSLEQQTAQTKPLWAPLDTDAPITLDTKDDVYVCQLCGCWYETRRGLSSHARSHLRQIGIPDGDIKGSPIDFLYQLMAEEDLKPISSKLQEPLTSDSPSCSSSKRPSDPSTPPSPPRKLPKLPSKDYTCVLCGESFGNRKGLGSHARSHLRQIGVIELLGKKSAVDTIGELVSSGVLEPLSVPKTKTTTSPAEPPVPPGSPTTLTLSPGPSQSQTPLSSNSLLQSPAKKDQSPQTPVSKAPKAKKGFCLAVDPLLKKPKPEPVESEISNQPKASSITSNSPAQNSPTAVASNPLNTDVQSPPTVLCDFCGQLFDTRKALSCHARAHLRQLGLTWSIRTSPIDLLKEVMMRGEEGQKGSSTSGKVTWNNQGSKRSRDSLQSSEPPSNICASPLDYSMKEKSPSGKSLASHTDASCELCGFEFENRKALASHARAHLRQLGLYEWKADGASSPIELLSELIRKDPARVSAITQRYRMGDLYIKKAHRGTASPSLSLESDSLPGSSFKAEQRSSREDSPRQSQVQARTGDVHIRSSRGIQPPKRVLATREEGQDSQQPPRSGSIPAMLPKPPLTPLVKLVGKVYSLKCRFCEEVFHGPLSVQEKWITHLQKHILSLGYKGKASPPAQVAASALVDPVAV